MPIEIGELEALLRDNFPDAEVEIEDLAGDNDHYAVTVVSSAFEGKSRIEQHKMVQKVVEDRNIHALSIKTKAP